MKRVFIAGHKGMVGSAILSKLLESHDIEVVIRSREELDLTCQRSVRSFFANNNIDEVYLAAAKVGGIHANNVYPADFIYENLIMEANVIHAAHLSNVQKLLFLGSSCIYPRLAEQPISEASLLTGALEKTNEPYAIAKIAGIKLCESYKRQYGRDYRSVMPTNLYGPNDNFHLENAHVIPALLRRFHEAVLNDKSEVLVWGSGNVKREFLYVDDMAEACVYLMGLDEAAYNAATECMSSHINIGTGIDCTIKELVKEICKITKFEGRIIWDTNKPDGPPRKLLDVSYLKKLGWEHSISLHDGLQNTYDWFLANSKTLRA